MKRNPFPYPPLLGFNVYTFYYRHQKRACAYMHIYTINNQLGTASFLSHLRRTLRLSCVVLPPLPLTYFSQVGMSGCIYHSDDYGVNPFPEASLTRPSSSVTVLKRQLTTCNSQSRLSKIGSIIMNAMETLEFDVDVVASSYANARKRHRIRGKESTWTFGKKSHTYGRRTRTCACSCCTGLSTQ
jgi:hypothetical protein